MEDHLHSQSGSTGFFGGVENKSQKKYAQFFVVIVAFIAFTGTVVFAVLLFAAQRFLWAAAILALASAFIRRFAGSDCKNY